MTYENKESMSSYMNHLINSTFKLLPMKENKSTTLDGYISSLKRELIGCDQLWKLSVDEPRLLSVISIIEYLSSNECELSEYRSEIFKCIRIIRSINEKYFGGGIS